VRVKICGITRVEDALAAERCGADAVGVVLFSDSPRRVAPGTARRIFAALGPCIARVAVTHTASHADLQEIMDLHPTAVQISHPFDQAAIGAGVKVLRVVGRDTREFLPCDAYVLDDSRGSATPYDPECARALTARSCTRIILAGGLTPENVGEAIRMVRPYAVDVASGVEVAPGIKDPARIGAFLRACREAER
jgi:phosphoribosylanthranilate isomerase